MKNAPRVTPWPDSTPPTRTALWQLMVEEGLDPYAWSNGPFDIYSAHSHSFDKVIYVVQGSITFGLPELNQSLILKPGDKLDLPAGVVHDAHVGEEGVVCLEGHK
ncbi:MAG: cupin [Chloroflexi bacterium]|nr:MAG: cupin [Chloroflexota bacterium]